MAFSYTNRNGLTYYLACKKSRTGTPRYFFARTPGEGALEALPAGYEVSESVQGLVSIRRILPQEISEAEQTYVRQRLAALRPAYRLEVKGSTMTVMEPEASPRQALERLAHLMPWALPGMSSVGQDRRFLDRQRFSPVLRFRVSDAGKRQFELERMTYSGAGGWSFPLWHGTLEQLAERWLPLLGTDALFEAM